MAENANIRFLDNFQILGKLLLRPRETAVFFVANSNLRTEFVFILFSSCLAIIFAVPELYYAYKIGYPDIDSEYVFLIIGTLISLALFPLYSWFLRKTAGLLNVALTRKEASSITALSYGLGFWGTLASTICIIITMMLLGNDASLYDDTSLYIICVISLVMLLWVAVFLNAVTKDAIGKCLAVTALLIFFTLLMLAIVLLLLLGPLVFLGEN